jgi:hypothetical protein
MILNSFRIFSPRFRVKYIFNYSRSRRTCSNTSSPDIDKLTIYCVATVFLMYFSVTQTAAILGVSAARVRKLVSTGRIQGAFKIANVWAIPLVDGKPVAKPGRRGPKLSWSKRRPQAVSKIHVNQNIILDTLCPKSAEILGS